MSISNETIIKSNRRSSLPAPPPPRGQSYDYGFAQGPFQESHGGSTYCAVAALWLMGKLDGVPNRDGLIRWLLDKQQFGFCGRVNKKVFFFSVVVVVVVVRCPNGLVLNADVSVRNFDRGLPF